MTLPTLPARGADCPPAIDLERAAAGEDVAAVRAHLPGCEACRQYVEQLEAGAKAFLAARPADRFLGQLEARRSARPSWPRALVLAASAAAALALVVTLARRTDPPVLFKGSLLTITAKREGVVKTLADGDALREGDALRFSVATTVPGYAVVLERDGQGKVTVVAPFGAVAPQAIGEGTTVLDDAAELDATKGRETFVGVFAPRPFEVGALVKQLEGGAPVSCAGCTVEARSFEKP
jgi:hypothetical protein